jgi:hypothetical protein
VQRVVDLDLDFFVHRIAQWRDRDGRLDDEASEPGRSRTRSLS